MIVAMGEMVETTLMMVETTLEMVEDVVVVEESTNSVQKFKMDFCELGLRRFIRLWPPCRLCL